MRAFTVSNPSNLARMISLGVMGPRAIYGEKHRPDGTNLAGGRLLLHDAVPDAKLLERVASPSELVLVELEVSGLPDWTGSITLDGVLPIDQITAAHFPSESAAKEFVTTPFANVDPQRIPVEASPHYFDSSGVEDDAQPSLMDLAPSANVPESALSDGRVRHVDRIVGALLEILIPAVPTTNVLAAAMRAVAALDAGRPPVLELIDPAGGSRDFIVAVNKRLVSLDQGQLETRRLLDEIASDVSASHRDSMDRASRVARNREDLGELASWDDSAVLALLLSLLTESPESIRDQFADSGAEPETLTLALWFSGLRRGHARRPNETRVPGLQELGVRLFANVINRHTGEGPVADIEVPQFEARWEEDAYVYRVLCTPPAVVGTRPLPTPLERLHRLDGPARVALAAHLDVPVTTEMVVQDDGQVVCELGEGGFRLRVWGAHSFERLIDEATLIERLDALPAEELIGMADEFAPAPPTAP